jgi:hypothetical protein
VVVSEIPEIHSGWLTTEERENEQEDRHELSSMPEDPTNRVFF